MPVNTNDVIRTTSWGHLANGEQWNLVFHHQYKGVAPADFTVVLADMLEFAGVAWAKVQPRTGTLLTWDGVKVYDVTQDCPVGEDGPGVPQHGTGAGDLLPPGCSPLGMGSTTYKRTRGRKFPTGFVEEDQSKGVIGQNLLASMAELVAWWIATFTSSGGHIYWAGVFKKVLGVFAQFVGGRVTDIMAYQRRRRQGRGI